MLRVFILGFTLGSCVSVLNFTKYILQVTEILRVRYHEGATSGWWWEQDLNPGLSKLVFYIVLSQKDDHLLL